MLAGQINFPALPDPIGRPEFYCSAVPPGPRKAGIGVPSMLFPAIWLFLNDCNAAPPLELTPTAFPVIVVPPILTVPAAPDAAIPFPKLFTICAPEIVRLRA